MEQRPGAAASPREFQLRRLVGRAGLPGLVTGALSLLIVLGMLGYLTLSLQPRLSDLREGSRAMRDGHDAMLDQETGVRGFLASNDDDFLDPYRAGLERSVDKEGVLVRALSGQPDLVALAIDAITSQHEWQTQWAVPAADGDWETVADADADGRIQPAEVAALLQRGKVLFDAYRVEDQRLQDAVRVEIDRTEDQISITLWACAAALVALGLLSMVLLLRWRRRLQSLIVTPVLDLTATVDRVRRGDLDVSSMPSSPVIELAELGEGVSAMTRALVERREASATREAELVGRTERLQRVLDLSRDLTESLSLRYTTLRLVEAVCELSGAERVDLWLQGEGAQELVLFEHSSKEDPEESGEDRARGERPQVIDVGVGPIGRAARYGRALPLDETGGKVDETTGVAIPMVVGAQVVAVIAIAGSPDQPLDLSLIDGLLLQGASAIQAAQLHAEVEEMSRRDALTGLANRRQFDADLRAEVERSQRYDRPLSLVMIDLDHFKRINDVYGHRRGDEVLQDVAGLLTTGLREIDNCYRYGGEELCILMPESTAQESADAAERIRERVEGSFPWATKAPVTLSAGVAQLTAGSDPAVLVGAADQALYAAKHGGRNRVELAVEPTGSGTPVRT